MGTKRSRFEEVKIKKSDLPTVYAIKQINLTFLMDSKKGIKDSSGSRAVYHLRGMSYSQMKKYIQNLPAERTNAIERILSDFPIRSHIFNQCAYYYRAFSRTQVFFDANHRTGFFSLANILRKKGILIDPDEHEIISMSEYIRGKGWLKMGDLKVNLKEHDEEYEFLVEWFEEKLKFR